MKKVLMLVLGLFVLLGLSSPVYAYDITIGNTAETRPVVDTYHDFSIVDTNNPSQYDGNIEYFEYWASNTNPFKFLIVNEDKDVMWTSALVTPTSVGVNTYEPAEYPVVETGWDVGFWFQNTGTIPFAYDATANSAYYTPNGYGEPTIGNTIAPQGTTERFYSFVAYGWVDTDGDGIYDENDYCPTGTIADTGEWNEEWGTNRWQVMEDQEVELGWYQNKPAKKGLKEPVWGYDMDYTYGCDGHQILQLLKDDMGDVMNGHWKFGLSSSVLEEFNMDLEDGVLDGRYYLGSYKVPVTNSTGITTDFSTVSGLSYYLEVSGTYRFANWGEYGIADAEWSYRNDGYKDNPLPSHDWTVGELTYPSVLGLDVLVNSNNVNWGDFSAVHEYNYTYLGTGNPFNFSIYDSAYGDNSDIDGGINVDIYADL